MNHCIKSLRKCFSEIASPIYRSVAGSSNEEWKLKYNEIFRFQCSVILSLNQYPATPVTSGTKNSSTLNIMYSNKAALLFSSKQKKKFAHLLENNSTQYKKMAPPPLKNKRVVHNLFIAANRIPLVTKEQTEGALLNYPVSLVLANLFMEARESKCLKPTIWLLYVHDAFLIWRHWKNNSRQPNVKFTMKIDDKKQLFSWPFYCTNKKTTAQITLSTKRKFMRTST